MWKLKDELHQVNCFVLILAVVRSLKLNPKNPHQKECSHPDRQQQEEGLLQEQR